MTSREAIVKSWQDPIKRANRLRGIRSSEARKKKSKSMMLRWEDEDYRKRRHESALASWTLERKIKVRKSLIRRWADLDARQRLSDKMKSLWDDNEYAKSQYAAIVKTLTKLADRSRMTKGEKRLSKILDFLGLAYKFMGARKNVVGRFTPDFVDEGRRKAIEFFGGQHHGSIQEDKERLDKIKKMGWKVLVVWDTELMHIIEVAELKKLIKKILEFDQS